MAAANRNVAEGPDPVANHVRDRTHRDGAGAKAERGEEEPLAPGLVEMEGVMPPKPRRQIGPGALAHAGARLTVAPAAMIRTAATAALTARAMSSGP